MAWKQIITYTRPNTGVAWTITPNNCETHIINTYEDTGKSEESKLWVDGKRIKTKAQSYPKTNVIESHNTTNSFCLNTRAIHGIATNCDKDRIILSISMKDEYNDYDKLKQMYKTNDLLRT